MKALLCAAATALVLSACASAPATEYHRLPDAAYRLPDNHKPSVVLKVVLAEPLKGNALLYQTDAHTVHFAKQHLWSQALDIALRNQLANELNRRGSAWRFVPAELKTSEQELVVYIESFQGRYDGSTQIDGYTAWRNNNQTTPGRNFSITTPQQGDGYNAMVESLSLGLQQVAAEILP